MSESSRTVSRQEIDKITFGISSLDHGQRELVRQHLYRLHDRTGGVFYKESFHHDLLELRESNKLSEIDYNAVLDAFFG